MTYGAKITEIIKQLKDFLHLESTKVTFRLSASDFSRNSGKLDFSQYVLLGISLLKSSLACEVYNILTINDLAPITKSAYSQGRYKIKNSFYQKWSSILLHEVYQAGLADSCWRGYGVEAIDGTSLILPQTKALATAFGVHKNKTDEIVMAKCLVRVDILNKYILQSVVFKTTKSEISTFKDHLWNLSSRCISLMDRGFANAALFGYLVEHNKPFVCRLKVGFNTVVKDFVASEETDRIVAFTVRATETFINQAVSTLPKSIPDTEIGKGMKVTLRLVKIILPSGQTEVLATNLTDSRHISLADLGDLYGKRWGIETCIDELKNQFLCTVFSGIKPEAILQDMHATVFVYNLRRLLMNDAQSVVNESIKESTRAKYPQKINQNVALGVLKPKIMTLFLTQEPHKIIQELITFFTQNKMPIVPKKTVPKRKPSLAKRRNLVIQTNYKNAL
jgi:Transposase DDE domain